MTDEHPHEMPEQQPEEPARQEMIPPPPPMMAAPGYPYAQESSRPTAVLVLGILMLVFAGWLFFTIVITVASLAMIGTSSVELSPAYIYSQLGVLSILLIVDIVMGIGLIRMARWARRGTIITMIVAFIWTTVSTILSVSIQLKSGVPASTPFSPGTLTGIVIAGAAMKWAIGLAESIVFIYILTRPNIVQAFERAGTPDSTYPGQ